MAQRRRAARNTATKAQLRLLSIAHDESQPAGARAIALTDYAKSKRTLPRDLAALRRQLLTTMNHAGQIKADLARLLEVDHARISRLLAQTQTNTAGEQ